MSGVHSVNYSVYRSDGTQQLSFTVPDSITTWVLTAFTLNQDDGFAVSRSPSEVR